MTMCVTSAEGALRRACQIDVSYGLLNSMRMSRPGLDPGAVGGLGGVSGSRRGRTRKANTAARATTPAQTSEPRLRPATKARFAASMITAWVLAGARPATWRAAAGDCCRYQ